MKSVVTQLTLYVLLLSAVRFATFNLQEWEQYRSSKEEKALVPLDGSLAGINAKGELVKPELVDKGQLRDKAHLVVFVLHRNEITREVQYWNRVIDLTGKSRRAPNSPIEYWGICDKGLECNSYQPIARFTILGFLDPFEMRIVAKADTSGESLVYDHTMMLQARIARADDPSAESNSILERAK